MIKEEEIKLSESLETRGVGGTKMGYWFLFGDKIESVGNLCKFSSGTLFLPF